MDNVVIATIKSWNIKNANKLKEMLKDKFNIFVITNREDLVLENLRDINPRFIFFPHWSWKIPREIYENFECVVFHMTDLPFGRGGSPLQNLIQRKIYNTKISAIRVEEGLDTGKVYLKRDIYIGLGSAEEIFMLASEIIFYDMIPFILENNPVPKEQKGKVITFKRRTPEQSNIQTANLCSLEEFYDFIRMLDAEDYPKAFIRIGKFKILFFEVHKKSDKLVGRFEVIENEEESPDSSCTS
ncbi:methionyl-tRNA formyltransferase [Persephonella sp.]